MLRNDIIKKSKADRKAYELFILLGGMYDAIMHEVNENSLSLDEETTNDSIDIKYMRVIRNALVTLNDVEFTFFSEVMNFIDLLDKTAGFERRPYTGNEVVKGITNILDKVCYQFSWYREVIGIPMSNEEIVELLSYDCDINEFKVAYDCDINEFKVAAEA